MKRKTVKKCIAIVLMLTVCLSFWGCADKNKENSYRGAESPDQAITTFIRAVSDKESKDELLKFFPVEWIAQGYDVSDLPEQAEKYREPEFLVENFQTQLSVLVGSLFLQDDGYFAEGYKLPDGFDPASEDAMHILIENIDFLIQQLREPITLLRCDFTFSENYIAQSAEYFEKTAKRIGAQDMAERVILIEYEGKTYMTGFTLAQYHDKWYVTSLTSNSAQLSSVPGFRRITLEDYEKRNW